MKKYSINRNNESKKHFELKNLAPYVLRNKEKASIPHRHSFYQILWFKESGQHYIDYELVSHPAYSLFLINKNQVHYFCEDSTNEGFLFHFNDSFISEWSLQLLSRFSISIFNEVGESYIVLSKDDISFIEHLTTVITGELEVKDRGYYEFVLHQFISFLYFIERINHQKNNFSLDENSDFYLFVRFKQLVIQKMEESLSVQEFADLLNLTARKLTSIVKKQSGLTPTILIKNMKILEAKRILSNQRISIKEVAYRLGFDQPTYFTKFFKKEVKITPKQFREQL